MLELLIKATLLLALALGIAACLPRTQPRLRHQVLLTGLLVLPLLPLFALLPPLIALPQSLSAPVLIKDARLHSLNAPVQTLEAPVQTLEAPVQPWLPRVLLTVYGLGVLVFLLRFLSDQRALRRVLRTAVPSAIGAPFPVWLTPKPTIPLACGLMRRRILLPQSATGWEAERLQAVLLHESAHLLRRDPLWQALTELIRALFWFHPLVWLVVFRLRSEAESACDRHVLASGIAPDRYAHYLLEIVKMLKTRPAAPAMAHTPRLEGRVRSILAYLPTRPARATGITLALLGLATVPLLAARPAPQQEKTAEKVAPIVRAVQLAKAPKPTVKAAKPTPAAQPLRVAKRQDEKVLVEKRRQEAVARLSDAKAKQLDEEAAKRKRHDEELEQKKLQIDRSRQQYLEPLQEELDELKIKLRDLDSRLTDKQLELAAIDREKMAFLDQTGQENKLKETLHSLEKQLVVLEKMIEETGRKRASVRERMNAVSER